MESFISDFYIGKNLHRIEILASPFKSSQKIYVDNRILVDNKGTLVNGHMFYEITVEDVPLLVSIKDCGLCCDFNIYLENNSILDGTKLDTRRTAAEKNIEGGFSKFMLKYTGDYVKNSVLFALVFILLYVAVVGFDVVALLTGLIAYPVALIVAVIFSWRKQKKIVDNWYKQYQQWGGAVHSL